MSGPIQEGNSGENVALASKMSKVCLDKTIILLAKQESKTIILVEPLVFLNKHC